MKAVHPARFYCPVDIKSQVKLWIRRLYERFMKKPQPKYPYWTWFVFMNISIHPEKNRVS